MAEGEESEEDDTGDFKLDHEHLVDALKKFHDDKEARILEEMASGIQRNKKKSSMADAAEEEKRVQKSQQSTGRSSRESLVIRRSQYGSLLTQALQSTIRCLSIDRTLLRRPDSLTNRTRSSRPCLISTYRLGLTKSCRCLQPKS